MSLLKIALIIVAILPLQSCESKPDNSEPAIRKIFVHGDPQKLLENANTYNKISFLNRENYNQFNNFTLVSGTSFAQTSAPLQQDPNRDVEEENGAADGQPRDNGIFKSFQVTETEDGIEFGNKFLKFKLAEINGAFEFMEVPQALLGFSNIEMIHYSVNEEATAFTLLFKNIDQSSNPTIVGLYFTKSVDFESEHRPVLTDTKFNYILGPGIGAPWRTKLSFDLCESDDNRAEKLADGIRLWDAFDEENSKIANLPFEIRRPTEIYPFTDLNQNCLQFVDDYLFENQDHFAILGLALPIIDPERFSYIGSHVFISTRGLLKVDPLMSRTAQVVAHEIGHMLGLDHEFDKVEGSDDYKHPSIMGYGDIDTITEHDAEAITALYSEEILDE